MSKLDGLAFGGTGLAAWSAATLFYAAFGGTLLESAFWFYGLNASTHWHYGNGDVWGGNVWANGRYAGRAVNP